MPRQPIRTRRAPSPLNGERAGVRGENGPGTSAEARKWNLSGSAGARKCDAPDPACTDITLLTSQQSVVKHSAVDARSASPGPRYQALLQLLCTADALWNASRQFFARWDLSPSQFNALNLLSDQTAGLTQVELSRQLIMHRSNLTGLVDRLEERGLLHRRDHATDRRAYRVVLTPAGRKLLREIRPHYYAAAEQVWEKIPVARSNQLAADLRTLSEAAERMFAERAE